MTYNVLQTGKEWMEKCLLSSVLHSFEIDKNYTKKLCYSQNLSHSDNRVWI